jgi:adenylate kinase
MLINLKMKTSDVFKNGEPDEEAEDPEAEAEKLKFPWHCETGIIGNARQLNIEFNKVRKLNPVKIFVTGPPASGKTFYTEKINSYYNIPRVHVKELCDKAFAMSDVEDAEEGIATELKEKLEELRDAEVEKIEAIRAEKDDDNEEPPEIDRNSLPIRVPDAFLYRLLRERLTDNDCRNRGYILDGFPRTYPDSQNIFLIREKKFDPETGEEIEEDEVELEEGEEKNWEDFIKDESIFPTSTIVFKELDNFLINRVKNLKQESIKGTHYNLADMKRRLAAYRIAN